MTARTLPGRAAILAALTALALGACSPTADGTIPAASRFGAREVPCEETTGFSDLGDSPWSEWVTDSVCWTREGTGDLGGLVTQIRDVIAPDQDVAAFSDPTCSTWPGLEAVEVCAIGGVVSYDPYTFVSVTLRPVYSVDGTSLLLQGVEADASAVEIHIQTTELGDAVDQWERDKEGTHID